MRNSQSTQIVAGLGPSMRKEPFKFQPKQDACVRVRAISVRLAPVALKQVAFPAPSHEPPLCRAGLSASVDQSSALHALAIAVQAMMSNRARGRWRHARAQGRW